MILFIKKFGDITLGNMFYTHNFTLNNSLAIEVIMNGWSQMSRRRGTQTWLRHRHVGYDLEPYRGGMIFEDAYAIAVLFEMWNSKFYLCYKYPLVAVMGQIVLTPAWKLYVWRLISGHQGGVGSTFMYLKPSITQQNFIRVHKPTNRINTRVYSSLNHEKYWGLKSHLACIIPQTTSSD